MYQFQPANDYQQNIVDQKLRKNDENGYNLWYQNYTMPNNSNNIMNFNNQQSFNNINANFNDPSMLNQPSSSLQLNHSNLMINNNFQNSVQQESDEGPINCERCQKAPIEYIRLNCGHNFCLECMAISFLKGEGRVIPSSQNQSSNIQNKNESDEENNSGQNDSIEMTCFKCGQQCELGHQSRSAIFIFIQMIIQKYEQKSSVIYNQQPDISTMHQQLLNYPINSTQTSSSAAFGMQINKQVNSNLTNTSSSVQVNALNNQIINGGNLPNQINANDKLTSIDNNQINLVVNQINGGQNINMQNNQAINQVNVNGSQIKALGQQQKQQQIIQGDQIQQFFDQNQIQFDNSKIIQPSIQKEDSGKNDEKLMVLSNNISNSNRVSNYTSNQNAIRGSDEDLLQYESIESNNIIPSQKQQLNIQADVSHQYQQIQQQQQQFQQRNRIISPNTNETQTKNFNAVAVNNIPNAQPMQNLDGNQMLVQQQASNMQYQNTNPNFETPYIKQQLLVSTSKNHNQIQSQDKIRISQHEQQEDDQANILQQQLLQKQQQLLQKGSQNGSVEQQVLLQQQQDNMKNSQYQSSQNNMVSTPNYSILTEKKPTQPQYSQMMPINNQTPQHTQNQAKKSPHLSKSTHIISNNVNLTPIQQQLGKNNYNLNSAQSQQFQNDYANNYSKQLQLQMEHDGTNLLKGDNKNFHPKLSAFSASNNKSQAKQYFSNFSHLQPYGNGEEANSIFEAQFTHNQKHLPYRQQSQLETGIIQEYEANQLDINENLQNQKAINLNQNLQQNQQDVQHQILTGNLQHQQINKLQLHQVDEIRESNSAFNSLIGGSTSSTQLNCNEHPFNELALYCFTCDNKLLCIKCLQNGEHRDHDVQSISKNFEYLLGKMTETSHEINSSIEHLIIQQKRLIDKRKECLKQIQIIKNQIQDNLNDVKASIASREQHLLQQAEQIFMDKQSDIQKEIQVIQNKTQVIQEVKNQFELICESYFKNKTTTNTDREIESLPHQQHIQEQNLQEQQHKVQEQQTNHIQQQLEQILQQKFYLQQLQNDQHIQPEHQLNQKKNNQQISQQYDALATENNSTEDLHETFKFSSEAEKISLYRFYQQCRSFLCQQGITRSTQGNEKLNMTQLQQQQSPQYSSYHLTPHQPRTTQFNETPRSKNNVQQQLQFQNISQIHQSGITSNCQSNQPSSYIQQHQMQQQSNIHRNQGNFESQYASIRSNISQPIEEEEYQQQQFQQNYQQYNIMSSQDLSQLIDDVQRIKKEATQIDLNNYASRQNTTLNNSNLNQKDYSILPSSSIQAPQRGNQLFHDYLNKQRYQNQLQQQYQTNTQQQHSEEKNNQHQSNQKEYQQEFTHQPNYQQNQKINQSKGQKLQNLNDEQNSNNYNQVKQPNSLNSQYLMQRLQENMENQQDGLNGTSNKKINSSTLNQNSYLAFPTQSSETELFKKDQVKNSSYLKQKRSKWLDEEALEQDQEHQNNYYTYSNQNQQFFDRINAIENFEQGNQKQKQEFNKHLDNIFRKNGILYKNSLLNKLQYQNSLEHPVSTQIISNSVLVGSNGFQTERLNTNPELLYNNINRSYTSTAIKQKQDFIQPKQDDKYKTEPFSPNFKRQMVNQAQYSYTTRASNKNTSLQRQNVSHLKVNASLSTHNNSTNSNPQKARLQKDQQINAQSSNYQLNQRSLNKQQNQAATQRDRNADSLFETLRIQKEQYNIKKKQYFLQD